MPNKILEPELFDRLWELAKPLLPPARPTPKGGRPRADDRACFEAIVKKHWYRRRRWLDQPPGGPSGTTCWRRYGEWCRAGAWDPVWRQVVGLLDEALGTKRGEYEFAHDDRPPDLDPSRRSMTSSKAAPTIRPPGRPRTRTRMPTTP